MFTLVLGVDQSHLEKMRLVLPTWRRHKPGLFSVPWVVFAEGVSLAELKPLCPENTTFQRWPLPDVSYETGIDDKWHRPQRYKMLAGFVHVPAALVKTPYWLKLDLDTVATGGAGWFEPDWFLTKPAIVGQPWGYTKPANQIQLLDAWADQVPPLKNFPKLELNPEKNSNLVRHRRIISWCAFFRTDFTRIAAGLAHDFCGRGLLPVPSQDGYLWYVARRLGLGIERQQMKSRGWEHWSTEKNVRKAAERAMT